MQRFELCYALPDCPQASWLLPGLLPAARCAALQTWRQPDDLALRYRYTYLPKGIINRLMVRLNRFVTRPQDASLNCVPFAREHSAALVELLPDGHEIELRARGPERKALLNVLAADLDAINDSFHGLRDKIEKHIPCNCSRCVTVAAPEFFREKMLRHRVENRQFKMQCNQSFEEVDALALLEGIHMAQGPSWAGKQAGPAAEWREKLTHLQCAEAKEADASAKFKIQKDMAEAEAKIRELGARP